MINKINSELTINIPLVAIYQHPSIASIAAYINEAKKGMFESISGMSLLKKGKPTARNFFIIHAGDGRGSAFIKLAHHMNSDFNYWGISYEAINPYSPSIISIEELATKYIEMIKKIQNKGSYYISGWCFGGVIAFEMARQLEALDEGLNFCRIV